MIRNGPERRANSFTLKLNGEVVIGRETKTIDGEVVGINGVGTFKTDLLGTI